MKIHPAGQGSLEWMVARAGIPTASEFDNLLTPQWKVRTGQTPETYLMRKLAERWQGGPLPGFGAWATEQGQMLEDEAVPWYEFYSGLQVQRVGLCLLDDGSAGCSPDGLIGDDGGLEIKCPQAPKHISYLLDGELPPEYAVQVHGSLWVTRRKWWRFVAYRRGLPPLIVDVEPDSEVLEIIEGTVEVFNERLTENYNRLVEMNGGPPPKPQPMVFAHEMKADDNDIIP